jgi:predicted nucleic acid-binding protein
MGSNPWVVSASPLILLGKTRHLDLLATLADTVVVPQTVANEVGAKLDGTAILAELIGNTVYRVAGTEPAPPEILAWDLGAGETQVITHALRHGADRVVLDDLEARRYAKAMGLRVIGTLGVVGRGKAMRRIARAAPVIEHLRRTELYVSDDLGQHLLREVGE